MCPTNRLTSRETEVLQLLASGHTYEQAAEQLGVSRNTVASHVKNIYRKLNVHSGRAAIWRALQLRVMGELDGADAALAGAAELMACAPFLKDPKRL